MMSKNAKSVFKGEIFEVFQWDQKMYDGTTEVFEALRRPNTAEIIATEGDQIVIQKQMQPHKSEPFLSLPGGRIELGEDELVGAKRELLEETGLATDDWELWAARKPVGKIDWTIFVYVARGCRKVAEQALDAGEKIELLRVGFDEFLDMVDRGDLAYIESDLRLDLVRARYDAGHRERIRKKIFG
jgi:ADP-ribose pyrophosphatase